MLPRLLSALGPTRTGIIRYRQRLVSAIVGRIRQWETRPVVTRRGHLLAGLAGLLLLTAVNVRLTASRPLTGKRHYLTAPGPGRTTAPKLKTPSLPTRPILPHGHHPKKTTAGAAAR